MDASESVASGRVAQAEPLEVEATYAQMTPDTFLARLCALVPPPGAHTVRYYGVLAGHHALRSRIIPCADTQPQPKQLTLFIPHGPLELPAVATVLAPLMSVSTARLYDAARSLRTHTPDHAPLPSPSSVLPLHFRIAA